MLLPFSRIALLIAIGVGVVIYFLVILLIGGVNEQELMAFPKGALLVRVAKKLHLLHDPHLRRPGSGNKSNDAKK